MTALNTNISESPALKRAVLNPTFVKTEKVHMVRLYGSSDTLVATALKKCSKHENTF